MSDLYPLIDPYVKVLEEYFRLVCRLWLARVDAELQAFVEALDQWLHALFEQPVPDWRERLDAFLAEQEAAGRTITPESRQELLGFLEGWGAKVDWGIAEHQLVSMESEGTLGFAGVTPKLYWYIKDNTRELEELAALLASQRDERPPITVVPGVWGSAIYLNDEYFADNIFGIPCIVCHGVSAQGIVGPPNSFRLPGGVGTLEYLQNWRDTTAEATLAFGAELAGGISALEGVLASATRTNTQLVVEIGARADAWAMRKGVNGTGQAIGTAKHKYAEGLLNRYQQIFGNRGLTTEVSVLKGSRVPYGTRGSVRLDVIEGAVNNPTAIYDYKFGVSRLSNRRIDQIRKIGGYPDVPILEVRP